VPTSGEKPAPRVLIVDDDVSDLLVIRRLLRETQYTVDTVRTASQAIGALGQKEFAAVVADDERLPDMAGAALLAEVKRAQKSALRVLLARPERTAALADAARDGAYQLIERPFFAKPLVATLVRHAAELLTTPSGRDDDTQRTAPPVVRSSEASDGEKREVPAPGRIAYRKILLTLAELSEAKAAYSSGHGARVSALAGVMARELGLGGEELEAIEDAALIHDVGEIAIDPAVLGQRRALTQPERILVQRHVESSFQVARRAGLAPLVASVRHHHEHVDGSGYPDGLAGEAIPLGARIIAIADTWDALATDRPYRSAAPLADCADQFAALRGSQLDAKLVSLFLDQKLYDLIDWSDPPRPGIKLL
jgi:response regulator RpfG family c-di-GMP phosphodiesterase